PTIGRFACRILGAVPGHGHGHRCKRHGRVAGKCVVHDGPIRVQAVSKESGHGGSIALHEALAEGGVGTHLETLPRADRDAGADPAMAYILVFAAAGETGGAGARARSRQEVRENASSASLQALSTGWAWRASN